MMQIVLKNLDLKSLSIQGCVSCSRCDAWQAMHDVGEEDLEAKVQAMMEAFAQQTAAFYEAQSRLS